MKKIIACAVVALLTACTEPEAAKRTLENTGMEDVRITGYRLFGCGREDGWRTGFEATAPNGNTVSGVVCSGILKGTTVRFD